MNSVIVIKRQSHDELWRWRQRATRHYLCHHTEVGGHFDPVTLSTGKETIWSSETPVVVFTAGLSCLLISLYEVSFHLFVSHVGTDQYRNLGYVFRKNVLCDSSRYTLSAMGSCYLTEENKIIEVKMQTLSYLPLLHECRVSVCV